MPSGGKELHCILWRRLFDACLVALESISPGQRIYYGTLRCHTLPSKENFPRQRLPPWFFCNRFFSRPYSAALSFPPRGVTGTSCYCFEYNLHLIKIPSHLYRESIYSTSPSQEQRTHPRYLSRQMSHDSFFLFHSRNVSIGSIFGLSFAHQ